MFKFLRRGRYVGRLAFDPDTGFHVGEDGRKVVTDDAGSTWRYATRKDTSHQERYHQKTAVVNGTTDADPHHHSAPGDDPHSAGLIWSPDQAAVFETSHTKAYA